MKSAKTADVREQVAADNPWYTGSQLDFSFGDARFVHALRESFVRRCIAQVAARESSRPLRVVEVGCGDGVNLYRLRDLECCSFYGLDYNELRLERARRLNPKAQIQEWDLREGGSCPIAGGAHVIIFSHVLEHIPQDAEVLSRLKSWLVPGGMLVLMTPNEGCLLARLGRRFIDPWIIADTDHVHFYTRKTLLRLVQGQGFQVVKMAGEVLTFPSSRYHMGLLRRRWGYCLLRMANFFLPSQTSGWQLALVQA